MDLALFLKQILCFPITNSPQRSLRTRGFLSFFYENFFAIFASFAVMIQDLISETALAMDFFSVKSCIVFNSTKH